MKYIYIITITFLLFSCWKQVEQPVPIVTNSWTEEPKIVTEEIPEINNTMVWEETQSWGGFWVPELKDWER